MTFQQFVSIIKARWLIAVVVFVLAVLTTAVVSFMLPKQYTASAALMVDVRSLDPIQGIPMQSMSVPGYMATQVDVIKSERVARKAAALMKLTESPQLLQQWRDDAKGVGSFESWVARLIAKKLDVVPARDSNVLTLSYTASDPRFAAAAANAFVEAYLAVNLELRVQPARQYSVLFEEQSKLMRGDLERAQAKLSDYQKANGLIATDERLDVENARLNELSSQLVAMQALSSEANSRRSQAGGNSPEVLNNAVVSTLKADLARQEARLRELSDRFGPAHPQVTELTANIGLLRSELARETSRVASSLGVNSKVSELRLNQIRASVEEQRSKVLKLKEQRDEAAVLLRDVESAQRAYESIRARLVQTSLESQSNQTNVLLLESAVEPDSHSSPKLLINIALSIFLGAGLAVGVSLMAEMLDRRLRTADDIEQIFSLPLIGEIPDAVLSGRGGASPRLSLSFSKKPMPALSAPEA